MDLNAVSKNKIDNKVIYIKILWPIIESLIKQNKKTLPLTKFN